MLLMFISSLRGSIWVISLGLLAGINACALPRVKPRLAPEFAAGTVSVESVALLPVDLSVQLEGEKPGSARTVKLDRQVIDRINRGLISALGRRGYRVTNILRPDGQTLDIRNGQLRMVIHPKDLAALRHEIHKATAPYAPGPGTLSANISVDLTRQLRLTTGSDASLYTRGWAYVKPGSGGEKAARIIAITLLAVVLVGVIILIATSKGGGGDAVGSFLAGAGRLAGTAARVTGEVVIRSLPHLVDAAIHCHRCAEDSPGQMVVRDTTRPPEGSTVGLDISMVHNRSGRVLWHAGQTFQVTASSEGRIEQLIEHFLKELPPASGKH